MGKILWRSPFKNTHRHRAPPHVQWIMFPMLNNRNYISLCIPTGVICGWRLENVYCGGRINVLLPSYHLHCILDDSDTGGEVETHVQMLFLTVSLRDWYLWRNFNYLCTHDLYSPVHNVLDACISIMRGSGRGLGPGIREFFGPCEMASRW